MMVSSRASRLSPLGPTTAPAMMIPIIPGTLNRSKTRGRTRKRIIARATISTGSFMGRWGIDSGKNQDRLGRSTAKPSLILWHRGIHVVRPGADPTLQVQESCIAALSQVAERLGAPSARPTLQDDLRIRIEFIQPRRYIAKRDQARSVIRE